MTGPSGQEFQKMYIDAGQEHEKKGELKEAYTQYKLADTVIQNSRITTEHLKRIRASLYNSAKAHYKKGLTYHKKGKYNLANKEFLTALRLWPDYPEAIKKLTERSRMHVTEYYVHEIKTGESISKLAIIYYGDKYKFPVIAKFNDLDDATDIRIGQVVKIPVIKDMPLLAGKKTIAMEEIDIFGYGDQGDYQDEQIDQVGIYRDHGIDLFNEKEYHDALVEFNKVLGADPNDKIARKFAYKARFEIAMELFNKTEYLPAREEFTACLTYQKDCKKCRQYITKCETLYKEKHYRKGMQCFELEEPVKAIEEWQKVADMDPEYKRVKSLIPKAKKIVKKIEELKGSSKE